MDDLAALTEALTRIAKIKARIEKAKAPIGLWKQLAQAHVDAGHAIAAVDIEVLWTAVAIRVAGTPDRANWVRELMTQAARSRGIKRLKAAAKGRITWEPIRPPGRPKRQWDRAAVVAALARSDGNVRGAARVLGVPRATLQGYLATAPVPPSSYAYGPALSAEHSSVLATAGISPAVAKARGYASQTTKDTPIAGRQRLAGLLTPVWSARNGGVVAWHQLRVDGAKGSQRYVNELGAQPVLDVSPHARGLVLDESLPLYVAESPRKADAATSRGLACVAIQGVRMMCLDPDEWNYIGVSGRDVRIVFDADAATNPEVGRAERALHAFLAGLGARVRIFRLPTMAGRKTGLDDYFAAGGTVEGLAES